MARPAKRKLAIFLAVILVAVVALVAATSGLGQPGLPEGDVALVDDVPNGDITQDQLDAGIAQAAAQAQLPKPPAPDDPQYQALQDSALQNLILAVWVEGETADRGITVSQDEIDSKLEQIKKQSFSSEAEFQQFVKQSGFTPDDVQEQVKLTILQDELQQEIVPQDVTVSDDEIQKYYEANAETFTQPASRDVRVVLNSSQAKAEQAKQALEADDSDASWKKVAKQYSTDESKDRGGLLEGLTEGQSDPQLEAQAFSAPEGEIVGPFKTDRGYFVIEVTKITPESTQPLDQVSDGIKQQLTSAKQQQIVADFKSDFIDKWTARTICAAGDEVSLCSNYVAPDADPTAPAVISRNPIEPGTSTISIDGTVAQGLPQGLWPPPVDESAATQLPAGAVPIGAPGAPTTGTTAPPTGAPSTAAPPTAAPSTAPPTAAPPTAAP